MSSRFDQSVSALRRVYQRFDAEGLAARHQAMAHVAMRPLSGSEALARYHDILLFLCAHPFDAAESACVEDELRRLAGFLKQRRGRHPAHLESEGLPFVDTVTRFGHDCVRWLLAQPRCRIAIEEYVEPRLDLNAVLQLTLPTLERNETTADLGNDDLLDALRVQKQRRLDFVVGELARLDALPYVKDQLFDALDLFVRVTPRDRHFSKAYNRLPVGKTFHHQGLLRQFDPLALMNQRLPPARPLDQAGLAQSVQVIRNSLALTARETDPGTYLDEVTLRVFDLERGIAVAIYGMTPERQLPLESYVGFTLFKNGLPAAYGGSWVLGPRANFGMNIFEPFRGGESGFMMCQVLRVYRQAFDVRFFEVEAHQFGLDNPDGIATGAFWFYYRHGFRPLDAALARLAEDERRKIIRRPGRRSSDNTLTRFTASNVALNFGGPVPAHLFDITSRVTKLIQTRYHGDRLTAERECLKRLAAKVALPRQPNADERRVLVEVAFVAEAMAINDEPRLDILRRMVKVKPVDLYRYQELLLALFAAV